MYLHRKTKALDTQVVNDLRNVNIELIQPEVDGHQRAHFVINDGSSTGVFVARDIATGDELRVQLTRGVTVSSESPALEPTWCLHGSKSGEDVYYDSDGAGMTKDGCT